MDEGIRQRLVTAGLDLGVLDSVEDLWKLVEGAYRAGHSDGWYAGYETGGDPEAYYEF